MLLGIHATGGGSARIRKTGEQQSRWSSRRSVEMLKSLKQMLAVPSSQYIHVIDDANH